MVGIFKIEFFVFLFQIEVVAQEKEIELDPITITASLTPVSASKTGRNILIISDKGVSATQVAIPALLALSAIHQHLVGAGLRTTAGLVVETGSAREVHHFAVLAGYGAEAVHPYLAMETLADLHKDLKDDLSPEKAIYNYIKIILSY